MSAPLPAVVLFEDDGVAGLGPVVALRPAWEVRIGALNLRERVGLCAGVGSLVAECRDLVSRGGVLAPATGDGPFLRLNARTCAPVEVIEQALRSLAEGEALVQDGVVVAAHGEARSTREAPAQLRLVDHPWEWIPLNDELLVSDARTLGERGGIARRIHGVAFDPGSGRQELLDAGTLAPAQAPDGVVIIGEHDVLVGPKAEIRPSAVIDASDGPVVIGAGVVIHPLSVVQGPAYVGPGTVVNPGAKLREGTSAGAFCKLGGEIEESIILDLSNKQHDGFLGHAILGSWVNLGADTNGSDLKNNYSAVKVDLGDGPVDTGQSFVGQHVGDHAKTGIDTMLTTGGVVGVAANVYGGDFAPRFVPDFSWGGAGGLAEYRLADALSTARAVYERRDAEFSSDAEDALRRLFTATAVVRERYGVR